MILLFHPYYLPLKVPLRTSHGSISHREGYLVELRQPSGTIWSEIAPLPGFSEESLKQVERFLMVHRDQIQACLNRNQNPMELRELNAAPASVRFGISSLWYLMQAQDHKKRLVDFLNKSSISPLPVNATLGLMRSDDAIKKVAEFHKSGYNTIKIKVGRNFDKEWEMITKLHQEFPAVTIRLDANRAWSFREAITNLQRLETVAPEYCEEPLSQRAIHLTAKLREQVNIPLAADESVRSSKDARDLIKSHSVDVLILKPMLLGSIEEIREIVTFAKQDDIPCVFTSSLESGVGRLITAHIASAMSNHAMASGLATGYMLSKDAITDEHLVCEGAFHFPDGYGIGRKPDLSIFEQEQ